MRTPTLEYSVYRKNSTRSHGFSLSLSGTPPLSLRLMPERTILLPFEHEPFANHCRQSVSFLCRGTARDGAADTARSP